MRLIEFFEGSDGRLSMTRLMIFLSFWPASYLLVTEGNEAMLGWYLGAFVGGYAAGKWADRQVSSPVVINQKGEGDVNNMVKSD